jgi:hypothetical protein
MDERVPNPCDHAGAIEGIAILEGEQVSEVVRNHGRDAKMLQQYPEPPRSRQSSEVATTMETLCFHEVHRCQELESYLREHDPRFKSNS